MSDLNSNVPISIAPSNVQAIVSGNGKNSGEIKYIKGNYIDNIDSQSIAYTSGTGSIYKSGIPVGRIQVLENQIPKTLKVNFYSNFDQLKYVFAEVFSEQHNTDIDEKEQISEVAQMPELKVTDKIKLDLLNEQIEIYKNTNLKFSKENTELESKVNDQNKLIISLQNKINSQNQIISQTELDKEELKFLKLNLIYSKKCKKTFSNQRGYKFGTEEYRKCVINKGQL